MEDSLGAQEVCNAIVEKRGSMLIVSQKSVYLSKCLKIFKQWQAVLWRWAKEMLYVFVNVFFVSKMSVLCLLFYQAVRVEVSYVALCLFFRAFLPAVRNGAAPHISEDRNIITRLIK